MNENCKSPRIQSASVRLRRKRDECKTYNRKSIDYRENDEANEAFDDEEKFSDDTLDHNTNIKEMKNNIRQVMRSKYKIDDSYTIKHFGYIDQPNEDCGGHGPVSMPVLSAMPSNQSRSSSTKNSSTLIRGVMWIHRDRYFSRWKERFIVVTRDFLQCYKRVVTEASQMGPFIHQIRLSDIRRVVLEDRKGYLTLLLTIDKDDNLVLRRAENIREWYEIILHLVAESRTKMMQSTESFWRKSKQEDKTKREDWLVASSRAPSVNNNEKYYINELFERPPSVASVDRRHRNRHRHRRRAKSHTPGDVMSNVSHVSRASTCHVSSSVSAANLRSVSVDRDSGNYSLQAQSDPDKQSASEF